MGVLVRSRRVRGSRAYHWGEDGLAGISDDRQHLCFALAMWNGSDLSLKENLRKNEKACEGVLEIQQDDGSVKVLAVRTKEEREIAEQTVAVLLRTRESEGKGSMNRGI